MKVLDWILRGPYFPESSVLKLGDIDSARAHYFKFRPNNLHVLLKDRFQWMNGYLSGCNKVIEFGAGPGFAKEYIHHDNYLMTDVAPRPWIKVVADALKTPFKNDEFEAIICSHLTHHLANPYKFLKEAERILKPGGYILISEVNCSLLMRLTLRVLRHEGWSYDVDIFNPDVIANNPDDPWSGNNAIPNMLFSDPVTFKAKFPTLEIINNTPTECFMIFLAGGVIAKSRTVQLPMTLLHWVSKLDAFLCQIAPSIFSLGMQVVVRKKF